MTEIKSEKDLIVVPVSYFKGMELMLEELAGVVNVRTLDAMGKFLCLREWMNPEKVNRESRRMLPNLRWDNIHLLLPTEESSTNQKTFQDTNSNHY